MIKSTRIRAFKSRDLSFLLEFISSLVFKIEIKEIVKDKNDWFVFYVLPEVENPAFDKMEMIIELK